MAHQISQNQSANFSVSSVFQPSSMCHAYISATGKLKSNTMASNSSDETCLQIKFLHALADAKPPEDGLFI